MTRECGNCGGESYAKGRCRLCYVYWRRHGTERPERMVIQQATRELERRQARAIYGPFRVLVARR